MTLAKWMDELDHACKSEHEMAIHNLPEKKFRAAYKGGSTPQQFIEKHLPTFAAQGRPTGSLPASESNQSAGSSQGEGL